MTIVRKVVDIIVWEIRLILWERVLKKVMCNFLCIRHISLTCVHIWFTIKTCFYWWLFWSNHNVETGEFRNNIDYHIERSYREYTHHGLGLGEAASLLRQLWSECYCVGHRRSAGNSIWTSRTSVSFMVQFFVSLLCNNLQMNCLEVILWHTNTQQGNCNLYAFWNCQQFNIGP